MLNVVISIAVNVIYDEKEAAITLHYIWVYLNIGFRAVSVTIERIDNYHLADTAGLTEAPI